MTEAMPAEADAVPFLSNIGLLMTYKCQVTCPHCIVQANPHRKEQVHPDEVFGWIKQLRAYRDGWVRIIALTGGEPFFDLGLLRAVAEYAQGCGLTVTAVTNAFWASSVEKAVRVLSELTAISNIAFSTDVYHQVAIPLENIRNGVMAATLCRRPYVISVCTATKRDEAYLAIVRQLREFTDDDHIQTAIALPMGRAAQELGWKAYETAAEPPRSACTSSSPIIFPDGRVVACIGPLIELTTPHPLLLGDLRRESMGEILERAQANTILHMIRVWGPHKLVTLIRDAGLGGYLPEQYIASSICQTCYHLLSTPPLVSFLTELAQDPTWQRTTAYGRAYYLEEPEMMEQLGV
jgi:MoaA/NifB/PqqE/SkfB family radical SAM enzyme